MLIPARHKINPPNETHLNNAKFFKYRSRLTMDKITDIVVDETKIPRSLIVSNSRKRGFVEKRQIIMYLAKDYNLGTYEEIGSYFDKDHSTCLHSVKVVQNLIDTDKEIAKLINRIKTRL